MKLYFFRHAYAGQSHWDDPDDFKREITADAVKRTAASARVLAALDVRPTHLWTSPLTRAGQTAQEIARVFKMTVEVREELGPGFNIELLENMLRALPDTADLMLFGHDPDFSRTISSLMGGGDLVLKKGGLARVDVYSRQPLRGSLIWLIAPKIFDVLS